MAYKFQAGDAILSGNLLQEGDVEIESGFSLKVHEQTILDTSRNLANVGTISGSGLISGPAVSVDLDVTVGADVIMSQGGSVYLAGDGGAAKIVSTGANAVSIFGAKAVFNGSSIEPDVDNGTDLGSSSKEWKDLYLDGVAYIDDLRADQLGAALDANSQAITNINVDSGAIDGTVIGANSAAAGSFAALVGTTGTFSGVLKTDDATEATSTTDGSLQTDGGLSVVKSAVIGDDLDLLSDGAILNLGADKDVNLTHVADTGLLLNSSMQLQFGDSGTYIHQSADGVLDLVSDTEIEINATTVDINGAIDASSTIVAASSITAGTSFVIGSADLNEVDMEKLDGITNGTAAANKAVVLDASRDFSGVHALTLSGSDGGDQESKLVFGDNENSKIEAVQDGSDAIFRIISDDRGIDISGSHDMGIAMYGGDGTDGGVMIQGANGLTIVSADESAAVTLGQNGVVSGSNKLEMGGTVRFDGVASATAVAADLVYFRDADDALMKGESFADVRDNLIYASVSGDATVAAGGALTIANDAVEQAMIADDAVGADQLAANAVVNASIAANAAIDMDKLDGGSLAASLSDLAQGDLLYAGDVDASNALKSITFSDFEDAIFGNVSGDATIAAGGALTIAAGAVESGMLNANVISGQTDIGAGLAITDEILVSDAGVLRRTDLSRFATMLAGSGLSVNNGQLQTQGSATAVAVDGGTLSEGYNFATGSLSLSVTLPSGSAGDVIHVKAAALGDGETLTINRNGSQTIDGQTSVVLESQYAAVSLVYVTDNDWRIV